MNVPNSMNNTTSTQQQQQPMTVLPHPSASFMINGQDPHAMGMAMGTHALLNTYRIPVALFLSVGLSASLYYRVISVGPFQYVQTPWGIFPASVITSHQPMAGQQQQQNPQSQASQRPLTPNQQQQQLGNLATDGLPAQQQQMNTQQVQMAPNFIDMSNGLWHHYPVLLIRFDQWLTDTGLSPSTHRLPNRSHHSSILRSKWTPGNCEQRPQYTSHPS